MAEILDVTDSTFAADVLEGVLWASPLAQFLVAIGMILLLKRWQGAWLVALAIAVTFLLIFYARPPILLGVVLQSATVLALVWAYRAGREERAGMRSWPD